MASGVKSLPADWQDKVIVGLSVLLVISPWLLGFADVGTAKWDTLIVGPALGIGAGAVLLWEPYWPDFIVAFLAFWLAGSSRILAFTDRLVPTFLTAAIGVTVIVLALWAAVRRARALQLGSEGVPGSEPPVAPPSPQTPSKAA